MVFNGTSLVFGHTLDFWIFLYLAVVMVGSSILALVVKNPVYTVLLVLLMIIHQAFMLYTLGSGFLTAVQIIVYAGAVLVLFLFVVYLMNLREDKRASRWIRRACLSGLGFLLFVFFFWINYQGVLSFNSKLKPMLKFDPSKESVWWIANYLFKYYLLQFEIVGLILLVAVLGAVFLLRKVRSVS